MVWLFTISTGCYHTTTCRKNMSKVPSSSISFSCDFVYSLFALNCTNGRLGVCGFQFSFKCYSGHAQESFSRGRTCAGVQYFHRAYRGDQKCYNSVSKLFLIFSEFRFAEGQEGINPANALIGLSCLKLSWR